MKTHIRSFRESDAQDVSTLIKRTLFEINSKDHAYDVLESLAKRYSAENLKLTARSKTVYVATSEEGRVVGTATIENDHVSCVFVLPEYMNKGIGRLLMSVVEKDAKAKGFKTVKLESSFTAHTFYKQLGYEDDKAGELNISMHKNLTV